MCGIAGFIDPRGPRDQERDRALAAAMAESLRHRGPDSNGVWTDPAAPVALGFRRLAIIDPGPEGDQPMSSAGGRYQLVFNGEIYNHRALRAELEAAGRREWRGESDTEVLIEAIANWGLRPALAKLNGMFALAVWDRERRVLFLARDRLGEKPLYYGRQDGVFLFASEAKALKRHPAWRGEVDREALALYLRHAYVPAPHSAWRGILKLAPGTLLEVGADGVHGAVEAYWRAEERAAEAVAAPFVGDEAEAIGRLDRLIADSVALRMVADVPVGAFLSGGIDSSTVVAALREMGRVRTFSIGFAEAEYDESRQAAAVARHLGTDHTELRVGEDECLATLPSLAEVYDEPFADASQIPTLMLCRLTRRSVTVGISGDGGDELFGGYGRYRAAPERWDRVRRAPRPLRRAASRAMSLLDGRSARPARRLRKLLAPYAATDVGRFYRDHRSLWRDGDGIVPAPGIPAFDSVFGPAPMPSLAERFMLTDALTYLPDALLTKIDRASMAASLEARAPLLDYRIAEFSWSLPLALKIRNGEGKWLLRQVLYRRVPRELVERPKMGFEAPVGRWLRQGLRDWAEELLNDRRLAEHGLLAPRSVRARWREHRQGRRNWTYPLWTVLMLHAWLEKETSDRGGAAEPPRPKG